MFENRFEIYSARSQAAAQAELRAGWEAAFQASTSLLKLFQSPSWFDHLLVTEKDPDLYVASARDDSGETVATPIRRQPEYPLEVKALHRTVFRANLKLVELLATSPLLPPDEPAHDWLLRSIVERFPDCDCIGANFVPTDSFFWHYVHESRFVRENFMLYLPEVGRLHSLALPPTFDDYLGKFKAKTRFTLRKKVKLLDAHCQGHLALRRYETPEQAHEFIATVLPLAQRSWQHQEFGGVFQDGIDWERKVTDLAARSMFRGYILWAGETPYAFVLGYQHGNVYFYAKVGFDQAFDKLSPGTVLLFLLIEDLYRYHPPTRLNFGRGDSHYKEAFGNVAADDHDVLLVRRTLKNRARLVAHMGMSRGISWAKAHVPDLRTWRHHGKSGAAAADEPS